MKLAQRCQPIQLILADVDGVLTDGSLIYDNQGIEAKRFHVRDGFGVRLWQRSGGKFGLITSRSSHVVKIRAAELEISLLRQGSQDKLQAVKEVMEELQLAPNQVCYVGDDLPDLAAVQYVGLGIAVADACEELKAAAAYVTPARGGKGAVRETVEMILKSQRRWDDLIQKYSLAE